MFSVWPLWRALNCLKISYRYHTLVIIPQKKNTAPTHFPPQKQNFYIPHSEEKQIYHVPEAGHWHLILTIEGMGLMYPGYISHPVWTRQTIFAACQKAKCCYAFADYSRNMQPSSLVYTDEWAAYRRIQRALGFNLQMVNHSLNFVDPVTGSTKISGSLSTLKTRRK